MEQNGKPAQAITTEKGLDLLRGRAGLERGAGGGFQMQYVFISNAT